MTAVQAPPAKSPEFSIRSKQTLLKLLHMYGNFIVPVLYFRYGKIKIP